MPTSAPDSNHKQKHSRMPHSKTARLLAWIANRPPISWLTRAFVRTVVRQHLKKSVQQDTPLERAATVGLDATLHNIVRDVVEALGYAGAMVATYEQGDSLPVRAFYVDPQIASEATIQRWERKISKIVGVPTSITDPELARVYVYREEYQDNLSVRAVKTGGPVTSSELYDLFRPIAPLQSKPAVEGIQDALGVQEVIALPFFLETEIEGHKERELVGNLFAAKKEPTTEQDRIVLAAFGRQVATAVGSERQGLQMEVAQALAYRVQTSLTDEKQIFKWIAEGIVSELGYVGAIISTFEGDGSLLVRAAHLSPKVATPATLQNWEQKISALAGIPVSFTADSFTRIYIYQDKYQDNLEVQAVNAAKPVRSDTLHTLFLPISKPATQNYIADIQEVLGIQQIVVVPFFLETSVERKLTRELVGNLCVATRSKSFGNSEIALLNAFGRQAAASIHNARLYRKTEDQRHAAQVFGKMAFSASTAIHSLRNHVGIFRVYFDLLRRLPPEDRDAQLAKGDYIQERLEKVSSLLDTLREPWRKITDDIIDVNDCVRTALGRITSVPPLDSNAVNIELNLSESGFPIQASPDMLTEAFRVLLKNAFEAIVSKGDAGMIRIESWLDDYLGMAVSIQDNGKGIHPKHARKIFNIGWSTKESGMGFGLFWTKDYIEGLGGYLEVQSVYHEGTTFLIYLPKFKK